MIQDNEYNEPVHENNAEEPEIRRGPRATAQRIQKQIMLEWFPDYRCAWNNE